MGFLEQLTGPVKNSPNELKKAYNTAAGPTRAPADDGGGIAESATKIFAIR